MKKLIALKLEYSALILVLLETYVIISDIIGVYKVSWLYVGTYFTTFIYIALLFVLIRLMRKYFVNEKVFVITNTTSDSIYVEGVFSNKEHADNALQSLMLKNCNENNFDLHCLTNNKLLKIK